MRNVRASRRNIRSALLETTDVSGVVSRTANEEIRVELTR